MGSMKIVYKPKFSFWPFLIHTIIISFTSYLINILLVYIKLSNNELGLIFSLIALIIFDIVSLFLIIIYPTMRYELRQKELYLICGPFKDIIEYENILKISKTNLKYDLSSSGWKIPGYALFNIYYRDRKWVKMYSTRLLKDIIIIETINKKLYGLSPKEEMDFIKDLEKKLKNKNL